MPHRVVLACTSCLMAFVVMAPQAHAELTARDIRTSIRTQWEFQPGQGPRPTNQRDFLADQSIRAVSPPLSSDPYAVSTPPVSQTSSVQAQSAEIAPDPVLTVYSESYPSSATPVQVPQDLPPPPAVVQDDWRNPPRAEEMLPPKNASRVDKLRTATEVEIGVQGSIYHYEETSLDVLLEGRGGGVSLTGQAALGDGWFVRGDGRTLFGEADYKGSGKSHADPNYISEVRAVAGRDLVWRSFALSPYIGLGYRYLYNDLRGESTTGASGYIRRSQYLFAPVGIEPRMMLPNGNKLAMTIEFDPLIRGWQDSLLSTIPGYPDFNNTQKGGYGAHGSLLYTAGNWTFGPFMNYWNINQSELDCSSGWGYYGCGYEPHNHTIEAGLQLRYKLFEQE